MPLSAHASDERARALEDLGDVDEVRLALVAQLEHLGHPCDGELGAVGLRADDLRRRAVGSASARVTSSPWSA